MWRSCNSSNTHYTLSLNYILKVGRIMPRCNQKESWGEQFSEAQFNSMSFNCIFQNNTYKEQLVWLKGGALLLHWAPPSILVWTVLHMIHFVAIQSQDNSTADISLIEIDVSSRSSIKSQRAFFLELTVTEYICVSLFFTAISASADQRDHGLLSRTKDWKFKSLSLTISMTWGKMLSGYSFFTSKTRIMSYLYRITERIKW